MSIHEKLCAIQQKLVAPKKQFNKFGNYHYRSCEDILEAVKPLLQENNVTLVVNDEIVTIGDRYYVKSTAVLTDCKTGDSFSNSAYAREEEKKTGMSESQITGACSSYARKYALNGLFCIDDVKDDDTGDNSGNKKKTSAADTKKKEANSDKVDEIMAKCKSDGIDVDKFFALYKVTSKEQLTAKQCDHALSNWEKLVDKIKSGK